MAVRKFKNSWWVDFRADHIRYRRRSPENTRAGAQAYEVILRHKLACGLPIENAQRVAARTEKFAVFAEKWFEEYVIPNNKLSEQRSKAYILGASLVPFFGATPIAEITTRQVEQYKAQTAQRGVTNKTINNRLTVLRKCLATAYEWLELTGEPPRIIWLKGAPPRTDYLSEDESNRLLNHADGTVREMLLVALRTGMRQGELKGLQWSSIDWETRMITVRHSKSDYSPDLGTPKSNRARHIPMHADVHEALHWRRQSEGYVFFDERGHTFDHQRLKARLAKVCVRAQLRHIGWHTLRHTFASHLAMRGVPLGAIQALLGHSNITTTMRYAHLAPSTLRTAVDLLTFERNSWATGGQPSQIGSQNAVGN